ncbi:BgTH12-06817 [Blumeria graminis f. sp. triticale]|uniref:5-formyltetrahydrofolate cyclo-ligase n=3 Tax=Blumeria graminis TaxID=34373 RepID=A0A9X9QG96_BLUGR|nr:510-methenyltetrahydrofolate synthetase [Blumeria graminis f. sp. tritici 96224]CAD6505885.1 BgTH12-06817 [Blumeria graminis f. sp. triticale]VDB94477.1 Bgt-1208 [Blumeria graminis f. sp. tritici]
MSVKKELRSMMRQKLSSVGSGVISEQSGYILKAISATPQYKSAKRIGIYLSMPKGEVQTDEIVRDALRLGKQVFVPYITQGSVKSSKKSASSMEMVDLLSLADYESLERDNWGIPSIAAHTIGQREQILQNSPANKGLDMILVPGLAFQVDPISSLVRRLGHGKGYYDRFLNQYKIKFTTNGGQADRTSDVLLHGLALKEQVLTAEDEMSIPIETHDFLLHGLVVGDGSLLEAPQQQI